MVRNTIRLNWLDKITGGLVITFLFLPGFAVSLFPNLDSRMLEDFLSEAPLARFIGTGVFGSIAVSGIIMLVIGLRDGTWPDTLLYRITHPYRWLTLRRY